MKKFLLSICCAFAVTSAFSQTTYGVRGGIGFASLSSSSGNLSVGSGSTTTFAAGLFADVKTSTNVSIQPGIYYAGKGGNYKSGGVEADIKTYYLQVPVNVVYHVPATFGGVYFGVGPYVAFGLNGKVKASDGTNSESMDVTFGSDGDFKRVDAGFNGIAGFEFKNGFLLGINYDLGLTDIGNDGTAEVSTKNRLFDISVGFKF